MRWGQRTLHRPTQLCGELLDKPHFCRRFGSANSTIRREIMHNTKGYAALSATTPLVPFSFHRRDPEPEEIEIQIQYCGVCHSDVHQARNEWQSTTFPCVPGHEIVGRVAKAGSKVRKFKEGELAAVG